MPNAVILLLLVLAGLAFFTLDSLRAREDVLAACRRACKQEGVLLLDETVALSRLRLAHRGRLQLVRHYEFEFTADNESRWSGRAVLQGRRLVSLQMDSPEGVTILI